MELPKWNSVIGMRNRNVHDYMNIEMEVVYELIQNDRHEFIGAFLRQPMTSNELKP
jgi:uncharacterized protein with HEPN domain